jgi:hypothetical protein
MSVRQDGSMPRTEALIQKMPDGQVINLSADPTGKFIVYNLATIGRRASANAIEALSTALGVEP